MVVVTKQYTTKFGELYDKDLVDLSVEAIQGLEVDLLQVQAVYVGNMLASQLYNINQLGLLIRDSLRMDVPFFNFTAACASGSLALFNAYNAVKSGQYEKVVVLGVEKMTDFRPSEITEALMAASDYENEYLFGLTFTSLYGLIASRYIDKYELDSSLLDEISIKAHRYACDNDISQFKRELSKNDFDRSSFVSDPLKLLHCSPFSDGASALLLEKDGQGVQIKDMELQQDALALKDRDSIVSFNSTKKASKELYMRNSIEVSNIDLFEVHDCFAIAEAVAYEDLGLSNAGKGLEDAASGKFKVNLSGGLKACGHPVGATGVKQIAYIADKLGKGELGLAHNVAGTGNTTILTLLSR